MVSYSDLHSPEFAQESGVPNEIMRVAHRLVPPKEEPGRAILVTSILPQEGKSTILNHLALACGTLLDQRVLIADLRANGAAFNTGSNPDLAAHQPTVGVPPHLQDLGDQLSQGLQLSHSIEPTTQPHIKRLEIQMSPGNIYRFIEGQLSTYRNEYRLIFMEAPALRSNEQPDTVILSPLFDQVIVVLQPQKAQAEVIQESLTLLRNSEVKDLKLMLNRSTGGQTNQLIRASWVRAALEIPIIGWIASLLKSKKPPMQKRPEAAPPPAQASIEPVGYLTAGVPPIHPPKPPERTYPSMEFDDPNSHRR